MRVQLLLLCLAAVFLIGSAAPANAADFGHDTSSMVLEAKNRLDDGSAAPKANPGGSGKTNGWDDKTLPIYRWGDSATHPAYAMNGMSFETMSDVFAQGTVNTILLSIGNFFYTVATFLTQVATNLSPLGVIGPTIDTAFASIGNAVLKSGLVAVVIVIALGLGLWQIVRRGHHHGKSVLGSLVKPILLVAAFGMLTVGATGSSSDHPGKGSPWWWADKTNTIVSAVASVPTTALDKAGQSSGFPFIKSKSIGGMQDKAYKSDPLSCYNYMKNMSTRYDDDSGNKGAEMSRSLPKTMSHMWEKTGLVAFVDVQFGYNEYGSHTFCHRLERASGVSPSDQIQFVGTDGPSAASGKAGGGAPSGWNKYSWATLSNTNGQDSLTDDMLFAACRYDGKNWSINPDWKKVEGMSGEKADELCKNWWTQDTKNYKKIGDNPLIFRDDIDKTRTQAQGKGTSGWLQQYVMTRTGWNAKSGVMASVTYVIGSLILSSIFVVIAVLVFLAKIGMIIALFGLLVALLLDTLSSGESKLKSFFMKFLGMAFVSAGSQLIFSVLLMMTQLLITVGVSMVAGSAVLTMIWMSVCPVLSVVLLHWMFKKWFKMPSPVTPSGARAWGKGLSAGNLGSALNNVRQDAEIDGLRRKLDDRAQRPGRGTGANVQGQGDNATDGIAPEDTSSKAGLFGRRGGKGKDGGAGSDLDALAAEKVADARQDALDHGLNEEAADLVAAKAGKTAAKDVQAAANAADGAQALQEVPTVRGKLGSYKALASDVMTDSKGAIGHRIGEKAEGIGKTMEDAAQAAKFNGAGKFGQAAAGVKALAGSAAGGLRKAAPGLGMAAAGGAIGTFFMPGLGTLAGAAIGGGVMRARGFMQERNRIRDDNAQRERENIAAFRSQRTEQKAVDHERERTAPATNAPNPTRTPATSGPRQGSPSTPPPKPEHQPQTRPKSSRPQMKPQPQPDEGAGPTVAGTTHSRSGAAGHDGPRPDAAKPPE